MEGVMPINLDNFSAFGAWVCEMVTLHTHQMVSKLPEYHEESSEVPKLVFDMVVDLAICFRPYFHPIYHESLS